jgi:hypothetical protein
MSASPLQYSQQLTPGQTTVVHELSCFERWFQIGKVASYFIGSVLFLMGSILYFPKYATLWDGQGAVVGSWTFFFGCIAFLLGTHGDFIDVIRVNNVGTPFVRIVKAYNAALYCAAAGIFMLGAVFFLPDYYVISASLGCWSFIIGCVFFCVGSLVDLVFITITHEDRNTHGVKLGNLMCWGAAVAAACFLGALCFILGSWYYLPRYIAQEDTVLATHYMNVGISYYTIGSVFFIINAVTQIPGMLAKFKAGSKAPAPKDKETAEFA